MSKLKDVLIDLCDGPLLECDSVEACKRLSVEAIQKCTTTAECHKMLVIVNNMETVEDIQRYLYNAMLKHSGLGASRRRW